MFVQVIKGKVRDKALWEQREAAWRKELKPSAVGFLGSTGGTTADGTMVLVARFESEAKAKANSERPEQAAWFDATAAAFDGAPTFRDAKDVDVLFDGGSDKATFVQVMEGRAKDEAAMRAELGKMESDLRRLRPDLLGATIAWHGDGSFTQVAYFTSQTEARKNEAAMADDPSLKRFMDLLDGQMTFYDLTAPRFD